MREYIKLFPFQKEKQQERVQSIKLTRKLFADITKFLAGLDLKNLYESASADIFVTYISKEGKLCFEQINYIPRTADQVRADLLSALLSVVHQQQVSLRGMAVLKSKLFKKIVSHLDKNNSKMIDEAIARALTNYFEEQENSKLFSKNKNDEFKVEKQPNTSFLQVYSAEDAYHFGEDVSQSQNPERESHASAPEKRHSEQPLPRSPSSSEQENAKSILKKDGVPEKNKKVRFKSEEQPEQLPQLTPRPPTSARGSSTTSGGTRRSFFEASVSDAYDEKKATANEDLHLPPLGPKK